jgi:hypothetical protein
MSQAVDQPVMVAVPQHSHVHPVYPAPGADPVTRLLFRVFRRLPGWAPPLSVLVCFLGGVVYVLLDRPADSTATSSPTCLIRLTTGYDCPGCGGTRAMWFLLRGNLPAAARSHLLAVFAAPFLVYLYVAWAAKATFGWKLPALRVSPKMISGFLAVWAIFAIARNLPWAPFTWFFV